MKKALFPVIWIWLGTISLNVFAHGIQFLEFNPDNTSSLKVIDGATPAQVFFAQNDFLGGFDLWIANSGSSGTVTFDLLNDQGGIIATRIVTVPNIPLAANGTRFHVDFNAQLAVLGDKKYTIRAISSMPELRLYYSDRVQVLQHNAPFVSEYITGVGKLGAEEQTFSFKYALYETSESSTPIISNIVWTVISLAEMRLNFNANEPIDYRIEYGPSGQGYTQSTQFSGGYQFCVVGSGTCGLNIPVASGTTYQYLLTVKDSWGNQSQTAGTFTSGQSQSSPSPTGSPSPTSTVSGTPSPTLNPTGSPPPDTTPPIISNLRAASVTDKSVDIAWTTSEAANSHLLISTTFLITITDNFDSTFELEHLLKTGSVLNPSTTYIATVASRDLANNERRASISFNTLTLTPPPTSPQSSPPPLSTPGQSRQQGSVNASNIPGSSGSGGSVQIQWGTPSGGEPSDGYRIDIFDKNGNFKQKILVPKGFHDFEVPNLGDGEYYTVVYANNDGVFEKIASPAAFTVGEKSLVDRLRPHLLYIVGSLAVLLFSAWKLFNKKSKPALAPPV